MQVVDALVEGRAVPGAPPCPLRDVRTGSVVRAVRLLEGGVGVEVETYAEVMLCLACLMRDTLWHLLGAGMPGLLSARHSVAWPRCRRAAARCINRS